MIASFTTLCDDFARAPAAPTVPTTANSASGSTSFHQRTVIVPPLVPAHSTCTSIAGVSLCQLGPRFLLSFTCPSCRAARRGLRFRERDLDRRWPATAAGEPPQPFPDAHEPVRRDQDDREEDEADHGVERPADHREPVRGDPVRRLVVDDD